MPRNEIFHGNEELIERASGEFYEALEPHFSFETGYLNEEAAAGAVAMIWAQLMLDEEGRALTDLDHLRDIESGHDDAIQSLKDAKDIMDWL